MKVEISGEIGTFTIKDLKPRTMITGIKTNPGSIYIKVDKKMLGKGLDIDWKKGHSILFNVKTASLRTVDAKETCIVLEPEIIRAKKVFAETADHPFIRGGIDGWV